MNKSHILTNRVQKGMFFEHFMWYSACYTRTTRIRQKILLFHSHKYFYIRSIAEDETIAAIMNLAHLSEIVRFFSSIFCWCIFGSIVMTSVLSLFFVRIRTVSMDCKHYIYCDWRYILSSISPLRCIFRYHRIIASQLSSTETHTIFFRRFDINVFSFTCGRFKTSNVRP